MSTTKTRQAEVGEQTYPVPSELTHHQSLAPEVTIPTEPITFDLTTKAEVQVEIIRLSNMHHACTDELLKIEADSKALNIWGTRNFGPLFEVGPLITPPVSTRVDGRTVFNPEKNLKISAIRAYGWAKKLGKTADEARTRVLEVVQNKAVMDHKMSKLPGDVQDYINLVHTHYDKIGILKPSQFLQMHYDRIAAEAEISTEAEAEIPTEAEAEILPDPPK